MEDKEQLIIIAVDEDTCEVVNKYGGYSKEDPAMEYLGDGVAAARVVPIEENDTE